MLDTVIKKTTRNLAVAACFWLPEERKLQLERWMRGRSELRAMRKADVVIVSFGKSGRTWLRVMLSRVYQKTHDASERQLFSLGRLPLRDPDLPRIFFTHDNYIKEYTGNRDSKVDFRGRRVVLLVRDPRDVTVSQYFQWKHRMKPSKTRVNRYPPKDAEVSLFDFLMDPGYGLQRCIEFLNVWAGARAHVQDLLVVRYEDLRRDPAKLLSEIVSFMGTDAPSDVIEEAVEFASVENMRKLESSNTSVLAGRRMKPGDRENTDTYKVRRAKVGGYRDYFSDDEVERIDACVETQLNADLGYTQGRGAPTSREG